MVDAQWILRIFDGTHIDARIDRVQATHLIDPWVCTPMEWLKNEEQNDQKIPRYENAWTNDRNR
jgi:hypothetical protein